MTLTRQLLSAAAATAMTSPVAMAEPAIIFDLGGKFDKSFNEAAFEGAERWAEETGGDYREIELTSEAQREQALRRMAESGSNPVVTVGFAYASTLDQLAPEYPDTDFVAIDAVVDQPNVRNYVFAEHEGSYLVGVLAGLATESDTVGFVGGMDIPLIRKFACGYVQGVKAANPDATVIQNMTGTTPAAWNDQTRGAELTRAQVSQGADVVYHAAGGTGIGVLQAAADEGILGIGVDSNQNYLHPGSVLTSMLKRVDNAVYEAFSDSESEDFSTENRVMNLETEGVGYALDENNQELITEEMQAAVDEAKQKIISGEIEVHDYMTDNSCPTS
jgi:basic membrane protein A